MQRTGSRACGLHYVHPMGSVVAAHGLISYGAGTYLLHSMWNLPISGRWNPKKTSVSSRRKETVAFREAGIPLRLPRVGFLFLHLNGETADLETFTWPFSSSLDIIVSGI